MMQKIKLIIAAIIVGITVIGLARLKAANGQDVQDALNYPILLQLVTVFLLTATILILGLADAIDREALSTLIGGVSGYVLGRLSGVGGQTNSEPTR